MKLGLDIHGVITDRADVMRELATALVATGNEVHIISGPPCDQITAELKELGFELGKQYTHMFSITDYHKEKGTHIDYDSKGRAWMEDYTWDKTKGDYCSLNNIDLHIDDSDAYGYHFKTAYARFYSKNKRKHYIKED